MSSAHVLHCYGSVHPASGAFPRGIPEEIRPSISSDVEALDEARAANLVVQIGGSTPRVMAVTNSGKVVLLCAVGSDALAGEIAHIRNSPSPSLQEVFFSNRLRDGESTVLDHSRNPRYLLEMLARDSVEALKALMFDWNKLQHICFAAAGGITEEGGINPNNQTFEFWRIHSQEYFRSIFSTLSDQGWMAEIPLHYLNDADAGAEGEAQHMGPLDGEALLNCQWGTGFGGSARLKVEGELTRIPTVEEFGYSVVYTGGLPRFFPLWSEQRELGCVTPDNKVESIPFDGVNFESRIAGYGLCQRICEWFCDAGLGDHFSEFISSNGRAVSSDTIKAYSDLRETSCLTWKDTIRKDVMDAIIEGYCALRGSADEDRELTRKAIELEEVLRQIVVEGMCVVVDHARKSADRPDMIVKIALGGPLTQAIDIATAVGEIEASRRGVRVYLSTLSSHEREALAFVP